MWCGTLGVGSNLEEFQSGIEGVSKCLDILLVEEKLLEDTLIGWDDGLEKEGHKIISQSFGNWKKMTKNILSRLDYYIICQISRSIRVKKIGGFMASPRLEN